MRLSLPVRANVNPQKSPAPIKDWVPISLPFATAITSLLSVPAVLPTLDFSCRWNRTTCVFSIWIASVSITFSFPPRVQPVSAIPHVFCLDTVPCTGWSHFAQPVSRRGLLGCSQFPATMMLLGTLMYTRLCGHVFSICPGCVPKNGVAGSCGKSCSFTQEAASLSAEAAAPVGIPSGSGGARGFGHCLGLVLLLGGFSPR